MTILSAETDPDKLHDLKSDLDGYQVYNNSNIDLFVERYLGEAERDQLDPILDGCVAIYVDTLDEDGQVDFKGKAKTFVRTYGFLESIDMDSYRLEVRSAIKIALADQNAQIEPVPMIGGGHMPEPGLDRLSNILHSFNEQFGNIEWKICVPIAFREHADAYVAVE